MKTNECPLGMVHDIMNQALGPVSSYLTGCSAYPQVKYKFHGIRSALVQEFTSFISTHISTSESFYIIGSGESNVLSCPRPRMDWLGTHAPTNSRATNAGWVGFRTCTGFWSVRRWMISSVCFTIRAAMIFLPLLRPLRMREQVRRSTIGHCS